MYGNAWEDQLTSFDGQSVVYDAIGNPTSYLGAALTWSKGRLLTRYVNGDKTVTMQYDANGIYLNTFANEKHRSGERCLNFILFSKCQAELVFKR